MINGLRKSTHLPYQVVKGSFETRQSRAAQFTNQIVDTLSEQIDDKGISLSKLGKTLKKVLPENLAIFVRKNKDKTFNAQISTMYSEDYQPVMYALEFLPNKNNRIDTLSVPAICHEVRHLADSLYHPKFLSREQAIVRKKLDTTKIDQFYKNQIYNKEEINGKKSKKNVLKHIKQQTKKLLRGYSAEDKIDILQDIRYNLITEQNAYKNEAKAVKKLRKKNKTTDKRYSDNSIDDFMFDEKIQLFHDMTLELIQKERFKNKIKVRLHSLTGKKEV